MKTNELFNTMRRTAYAWSKEKAARKARKKKIISAYGWDSEELKAWYEEDEAAKFPFTSGEMKAYHAWESSIEYGESELEMNDFNWDHESHDFIETLREAGIKSFVFTNKSTALMENIHAFIAEGCTMEGACLITRQNKRWGNDETTEVQGIRFQVN